MYVQYGFLCLILNRPKFAVCRNANSSFLFIFPFELFVCLSYLLFLYFQGLDLLQVIASILSLRDVILCKLYKSSIGPEKQLTIGYEPSL